MGKTVTRVLLVSLVGVGVPRMGCPHPLLGGASPRAGAASARGEGAAPARREYSVAGLERGAERLHRPASMQVPRVDQAIHIDAEMEGTKVWESDRGSTGNFKEESGQGLVPYTDMKVRWGAGNLYLRLYAGDLDLQGKIKESDKDLSGDDMFHIEIGGGDSRARHRRLGAGHGVRRSLQGAPSVSLEADSRGV